ncbi:ABC transporter permease [bacterium]|nr:ABC transporter permease [bacterium]
MQTMLTVMMKDLRIYFGDRTALVHAFIVPMVVIAIVVAAFGNLFGGGGGGPQIRIPIVDQDRSKISGEIVRALTGLDGLKVETSIREDDKLTSFTEEIATEWIEKGYRSAVIVIPEGFGDAILNGEPTKFRLLRDPGQRVTPGVAQGILNGVATRLSADLQRVQVGVIFGMVVTRGKGDPEEIARGIMENSDEMWNNPPVGVETVDLKIEGDEAPKIDMVKQTVPGYAIMFALFTMQLGGVSLLKEKDWGTFRRLLAAPIRRAQILAGKLLAVFALAMTQFFVFFAFGRLVFGIDLGSSIPGLILLSAAVAFTVTSLGILMAAFVKSEGQLSGISTLMILFMSAIGGSWWPLEMTPPFMQKLAYFVSITAWGMSGFKDLLWYNQPFTAILPEVGVLAIFAAVSFVIGWWRFRFD